MPATAPAAARAGTRRTGSSSSPPAPTRCSGCTWRPTSSRTRQRGEWRIVREVHVAETTAQARHEALEGGLANVWSNYLLKILPLFDALGLVKTDPDMPDEALTPEWLLDNIWIVGSPDDVA